MGEFSRQDLLAFLPLLAIVDVRGGSVPGGDAAFGIANRCGARQEPAVLAVVAPIADLDLVLRALAQGACPLRDAALTVVRMEHQLRPLSGILLRGDAAVLEPAIVGEGDRAVRVGGPDHVGDGVRQVAKALLAGAQRLLGAFALGDVAGDFGGADDLAGLVADRRDRQGDVDEAAVLATPHRFIVVDLLAAPDALQDRGHFVLTPGRGQDRDVPAEHFVRGITKEFLRGRIPARDDAVQGLARDRLVRRLHDRSQPSVCQSHGAGRIYHASLPPRQHDSRPASTVDPIRAAEPTGYACWRAPLWKMPAAKRDQSTGEGPNLQHGSCLLGMRGMLEVSVPCGAGSSRGDRRDLHQPAALRSAEIGKPVGGPERGKAVHPSRNHVLDRRRRCLVPDAPVLAVSTR